MSVLTANGEVHTHEEAEVFVHDLNQFVTVQDHGYSYEWVSGQELRLAKMGKVSCRSRKIFQFQQQFAITGLVEKRERISSL